MLAIGEPIGCALRRRVRNVVMVRMRCSSRENRDDSHQL